MIARFRLSFYVTLFAVFVSSANAENTDRHQPCAFSATELAQILGIKPSRYNELSSKLRCAGNFLEIDVSQLHVKQSQGEHLPGVSLRISLPNHYIRESYDFAGLATYYNAVRGVRLDSDNSRSSTIELPLESAQTKAEQWLGLQGRYRALLLSAPGASITLSEDTASLQWQQSGEALLRLYLGPLENSVSTLNERQYDFAVLRYSHLWPWLAALCGAIEWLLEAIHQLISSWGLAIIALAALLKLLLLPISLATVRLQNDVSRKQAILEPKLAEIKANYDGEEAHNRLMAEYKALGITPFFTMKPVIGTLIQLPFLIAAFNVLGETTLLEGQGFLWVPDLAYPDCIAALPFSIPFMGAGIHLMPFIMTAVSLLATLAFRLPHATAAQASSQRRNLYLMSAAFFILFYPFPAAMVLYWTANTALQLVQQRLSNRTSRKPQ